MPTSAMVFVGPLPPPLHGKSLATQSLAGAFRQSGLQFRLVDISEGMGTGHISKAARKVLSHADAIRHIMTNGGSVYVSVNSGSGMLLSTLLGLAARLARRRIFWHHHSYDYVRARKSRMVWLARLSGPKAVHIALSQTMATNLLRQTPEIKRTFVLNNAGFIDTGLLGVGRTRSRVPVLGHLSNLTEEKGVATVVDLAIAAAQRGLTARLVLAGPAKDETARKAIARGQAALGARFEYRGPVDGENKRRFFADITHFVFPTRYRNEASPLVLYEAMAAGVPCVATALGCIAEDIGANGGIAISESSDFATEALNYIASSDLTLGSARARGQYVALLRRHRQQLNELVALLR